MAIWVYIPPLIRIQEVMKMDGKKVHMVNTADSMNARLADRPVIAMATPIMDMMPAPMI